MTRVCFRSVSKRYDNAETLAVDELNLACGDGEMLALLGPSGCGKSSTLKMAAGLEHVTSGEIFFNERPVTGLSPGSRNVAMVFEDYSLYPRMTVRQNIMFPLTARNVDRDIARKRVHEALELLDLMDIADHSVKGLSGGAMQRVSIGRALVRDPHLILFDEPLSHLDGDQRMQLRTEIKRLQKTRGITSILVTHDQTEATAMADRIAVMHQGILQQVDTPAALYRSPANVFVANFIGEPPMNMLKGTLHGDGKEISIDTFARMVEIDPGRRNMLARCGGELTIGVRPEHLKILAPPHGVSPDATVRYRECRGDTDSLILAPLRDAEPPIMVEIPGPSKFREGDHVAVDLPGDLLHLFDRSTGQNVEHMS